MAAAAVALVFYFTFLRYGDVETALVQRGTSLANQLAPAAVYGMFSGNVAELRHLVQATLHEPDVVAVTLYDPHGTPMISAGTLHEPPAPDTLPDHWHGSGKNQRSLLFHSKIVRTGTSFEDPFDQSPRISTPHAEDRLLGSLTLELSRERVVAHKREILLVTLGATGLMLLGGILLARRLGRDLAEPLQTLEETVTRIRRGELAARVTPHGSRSLQSLEDGINAMASALETAQARSDAMLATSEAHLHEQHEFANAMLRAQSDAGIGLIIIQSGRIVFANDACSGITGYSREELFESTLLPGKLLGRDVTVAAGPDKATEHIERMEIRFQARSGAWHVYDIAAVRLADHTRIRTMLVLLDITQRHDATRRLAQANLALQQQKDAAERVSAAKTRFLAAASHDLRQPLHALSLFTAEMESRVTTSRQRHLASQITRSTDSLMQLLDSLLDLSRMDLGQTIPRRRAVELGTVLELAATTHRHSAASKHIGLKARQTRLWVDTDPQLLERILDNLISNAIRYTRRGRIMIGVRQQGRHARVEVWDTGIGIAPDDIPHLFDEFYQADNPERDANKGLGLGLSIVQRLATALDHPINVRSIPGKGSVFAITLPLARPDSESGLVAHPEILATQLQAHALILSQNHRVREDLAQLLTGWGCEISYAESSDDLRNACRIPPTVFIADDRDLAFLTDVPELPCAPLIAIGAEGATTHKIFARLEKPLRPARLRALLQHIVQQNGDR
ncbi:MAG: PAS domain S-box protein [Proteobacteria bacterium]|nr:PAS domain S-box protein [Pseudomonadota bacterium]HQR05066.1 ATP-binding protein [Rhodocyclaceae bacterium]